MKNKIELNTELLILPDGRILIQNLTQPFAELLKELNPADEQIPPRTARQIAANVGQASRLPPFSKINKIGNSRDTCPTSP